MKIYVFEPKYIRSKSPVLTQKYEYLLMKIPWKKYYITEENPFISLWKFIWA